MAASLILVAAPLILASAPPPDTRPSETVSDQHRYYTLTVSQNNEHKSFDDNFIDMESAEVKSGNKYSIHYMSVNEMYFVLPAPAFTSNIVINQLAVSFLPV